jgi:hypothetical protein
MTPKQLVQKWVELFNRGSIEGLLNLYAVDAVNHQVVTDPLRGAAKFAICSRSNSAARR